MGLISHRPSLNTMLRFLIHRWLMHSQSRRYVYLTVYSCPVNNEAEVMGVLGHEMGHIAARHSVSQQAKQTMGTLLIITGMIASENLRNMENMQCRHAIAFSEISRDDEVQADASGLSILQRLYDA